MKHIKYTWEYTEWSTKGFIACIGLLKNLTYFRVLMPSVIRTIEILGFTFIGNRNVMATCRKYYVSKCIALVLNNLSLLLLAILFMKISLITNNDDFFIPVGIP